jgi:hypothetical protein
MVTITGTCCLVAFLLYRGVKSGGMAKGSGLALGPVKLSFEMTGGIAGFIVTLAIWLWALPPSAALPEVMVYSVDARVDMDQFSAEERSKIANAVSIAVVPTPRVLHDGKIDGLYVIASKDPANNEWVLPSIVVSPNPPLSERFIGVSLSTDRNTLSNSPELSSLSIDGRTLRTRGKITLPPKTIATADGG